MTQTNPDKPRFSHTSEKTFADILDFYQIEWQYEPKTFPLIIDKDGKIIEAFTPDFYLPEQDLFIELTTLKPKLAKQEKPAHQNDERALPQSQYQAVEKKRDARLNG